MDSQTALLIALALLTVAGVLVGWAGVAMFRRSGGDALPPVEVPADASGPEPDATEEP